MKKISKNFVPTNNYVYSKGKRQYTEIPKGMILKYYLYDEENNIYIGKLKRRKYILQMLITLVLGMSIYLYMQAEYTQHVVKISDTISLTNGVLGLNVVNDAENKNDIKIELAFDKGLVLKPRVIKPGESVGNVSIDSKLGKGSYLCTMVYTIDCKYIDRVEKFDVLLVVE